MNILYSLRSDNDIFNLIVLNCEDCILYYIGFKELFGDMNLAYTPDTPPPYRNDKSQYWREEFISGIESQRYMAFLVVIISHKDVLRDLKIQQSFTKSIFYYSNLKP